MPKKLRRLRGLQKKPKPAPVLSNEAYIGIDPSLTSTGIVGLDVNGDTLFATRVRTSTGSPDFMRCTNIVWDIVRLMENNCFLADTIHVFIEGYANSRFGVTAKLFTRIELVGMLKATLFHRGYYTYVVTPGSLKLEIAGTGVATKDEMIEAIANITGHTYKSDDIADAHGLALYGRRLLGGKRLDIEKLYARPASPSRRVFSEK